MTEIADTTPAMTAPKPWKAARIPARAIGQGIINLTLMILTFRDIRRRGDDEIKGNRKVWMLAACAPPIGPIAYFVFGRRRGAQTTETPRETIA